MVLLLYIYGITPKLVPVVPVIPGLKDSVFLWDNSRTFDDVEWLCNSHYPRVVFLYVFVFFSGAIWRGMEKLVGTVPSQFHMFHWESASPRRLVGVEPTSRSILDFCYPLPKENSWKNHGKIHDRMGCDGRLRNVKHVLTWLIICVVKLGSVDPFPRISSGSHRPVPTSWPF